MTLIIHRDGLVCCLYDEAVDLGAIGPMRITRASHVEPDDQARWWTDLAVVAGPLLGPFGLRSEALSAERRWLEGNMDVLGAGFPQVI